MRHRTHFPLDEAPAENGDAGFVGVVDRGAADMVPQGYGTAAVNMSFRDGEARPRGGALTVFQLQAGAAVAGSAIFSDPNRREYLMLGTAAGVRRVRWDEDPVMIATPTALAATPGTLQLVQAFSKVLAFRGDLLGPWEWDGAVDTKFQEVNRADVFAGFAQIPNGPTRAGLRPVVVNNRLLVPHGRTNLAVSDIADYTRYDSIYADFNITGGNDDLPAALIPFGGRGACIVLNDQSTQLLAGVNQNLDLTLETINARVGCLAGGTAVQVADTAFWLSAQGVMRFDQVLENKFEVPAEPVSYAIDRIIRRITWSAVAGAVAAADDEFYYLAVPIDGSTTNNALLPYHVPTKAWHGIHRIPGRIDALHVTDWAGRKRLFAVDAATGLVRLLYEGRHDYTSDVRSSIATSVTTRAYRQTRAPGGARFRRARVHLRTWSPSYDLAMASDGVAEATTLLTAQTKDRVKSMQWGEADYATSNAGDNHGRPYREDYSVAIETPFNPGVNGIDFDLEQTHSEPVLLRKDAASMTLTLTNATGSCTLSRVEIEAAPGQRADRRT